MSNSSRWRRLCEWVRHLQDTNKEIDLHCLISKMDEIKRGGSDYVIREHQDEQNGRKSKVIDKFLSTYRAK